ncbi:MAG: hypothetical protein IJ087_09270, partial [Eggerthellaceae bacterium]|nr:hypothetical protein [Eggerthellaceae bacterium]
MQHAAKMPIQRPPARQPRTRRGNPSPAAPTAYQVGRVRAWLSRNAGILCLGTGWLFAFGIVFAPKGDAATVIELGMAGAA